MQGLINGYDKVLENVLGFRITDWDLFAKCGERVPSVCIFTSTYLNVPKLAKLLAPPGFLEPPSMAALASVLYRCSAQIHADGYTHSLGP